MNVACQKIVAAGIDDDELAPAIRMSLMHTLHTLSFRVAECLFPANLNLKEAKKHLTEVLQIESKQTDYMKIIDDAIVAEVIASDQRKSEKERVMLMVVSLMLSAKKHLFSGCFGFARYLCEKHNLYDELADQYLCFKMCLNTTSKINNMAAPFAKFVFLCFGCEIASFTLENDADPLPKKYKYNTVNDFLAELKEPTNVQRKYIVNFVLLALCRRFTAHLCETLKITANPDMMYRLDAAAIINMELLDINPNKYDEITCKLELDGCTQVNFARYICENFILGDRLLSILDEFFACNKTLKNADFVRDIKLHMGDFIVCFAIEVIKEK